jgi:Leu/Phe-tRNA-protein transferase
LKINVVFGFDPCNNLQNNERKYIMTEKELLAKFANYMVANNHNDPLIYSLASDIIKRDGVLYCANRGMANLYGDARHSSGSYRARLDDAFRSAVHTCTPTPADIALNKSINESMMRDYWECNALGYSTE